MVLRLWGLGLIVALLAIGALSAQEIIVESDGPPSQAGRFGIHSGAWSTSTGKSEAFGLTPGIGSRFIPGGRDGAVVFRADLPSPGRYEVFATWCTSGNSTNVLYTINHANGQSHVTLTQDGWGASGPSNANQWISLGTFEFNAGPEAGVAVTSQASASAPNSTGIHRVYADAVRFVGSRGATSAQGPTTDFFGSTPSVVRPVSTSPAPRGTAPSIGASDLIVEVGVDTPEVGSFHTASGAWLDSEGKSLAPGLTHDQGTMFLANGRDGSGVFNFNIPASGTYGVYVTWCTSGNSTDALYTIQSAEGESRVSLTQDGWGVGGGSNANAWVPLGTFRFEAGDPCSVTVSTQPGSSIPDGRNAHRVYADAVRLVPQGTMGPMIASASRTMRAPEPEPLTVSSLVDWRSGLDEARAESRRTGKPVLIYAYTSRSRTCRENETGLLQDSDVVLSLNSIIPVRVDLGENTALAPELRIYRVPTVIVTGGYGEEISRHVGEVSKADLIELVNNH